VKAFSANTNVGLVRQYNEDRIAIILNVIHPPSKVPVIQQWPNIQIFAVYDGHGGSKCAEYLKDNLHNNIINLPEFPSNIPEAIRIGSHYTDESFLTMLYDDFKVKFAETK
jgi:protein phosphatase 2C family protein 2/3